VLARNAILLERLSDTEFKRGPLCTTTEDGGGARVLIRACDNGRNLKNVSENEGNALSVESNGFLPCHSLVTRSGLRPFTPETPNQMLSSSEKLATLRIFHAKRDRVSTCIWDAVVRTNGVNPISAVQGVTELVSVLLRITKARGAVQSLVEWALASQVNEGTAKSYSTWAGFNTHESPWDVIVLDENETPRKAQPWSMGSDYGRPVCSFTVADASRFSFLLDTMRDALTNSLVRGIPVPDFVARMVEMYLSDNYAVYDVDAPVVQEANAVFTENPIVRPRHMPSVRIVDASLDLAEPFVVAFSNTVAEDVRQYLIGAYTKPGDNMIGDTRVAVVPNIVHQSIMQLVHELSVHSPAVANHLYMQA